MPQNFCNGVQLAVLGRSRGSRGVEGVMLLHQLHVLWSSLAPGDSAAVYSLAATALLHPQSAGQRGNAGEARCARTAWQAGWWAGWRAGGLRGVSAGFAVPEPAL
jgi:hypothetical protein